MTIHAPEQKIALFDMDNTLADYDRVMRARMAKLRHPNEPPEPVRDSDADEADYLQARREAISQDPLFWRNLPLLDDGHAVWELAGELGFYRKILTQGPIYAPVAWGEKLTWIQNKFGDHIPVTITREKQETYGRILVEDWPKYCKRWLKWRPRGQVILLDRPWNQNFSHPQVHRYDGSVDIDRADRLEEVREVLIRARDRKVT